MGGLKKGKPKLRKGKKEGKDLARSARATYQHALAKLTTDKQRIFVKAYLTHFNATRAARTAGYSENCLDVQGAQNLANPKIRAVVDLGIKAFEETAGVTPERIERELARLAFSDMRDFASWSAHGMQLKPSADLDDDHTVAVQQITEKTGATTELGIKLHDKRWALEMLAKRHRYLESKQDSDHDSGEYVVSVRRKHFAGSPSISDDGGAE